MALLTSPLASLRGATRPRVRIAPDATYTFGPETTELSRRAGLTLDEWQADGVDIVLSVRADGKWACFEYCEWCSRQNGKTVGIFTPRALAGMFLTGEPLITWSAHEYKTAMEGFRVYKRCILTLGTEIKTNLVRIENDPNPIFVKISNTNGEESFERLDTGQRVKFIARSKGSGRGFGASNLIDETFAYTREQQDAIMPTILAQPNPQIGYASSPPLTGDTGEVMYSLRSRAENGELGASLGYRNWGLGGTLPSGNPLDLDHIAEIDLDDRRLWAQTNPAAGGRLTEEKIAHLRTSMSDEGFAREVLGIWPRQINVEVEHVIDLELWSRLADPASQIVGSMVFAADCNPERTRSAIAAVGQRADGDYHGEIIDDRAGTSWVPERLVELVERWNPPAVLLDPAGPAGSWLADLKRADSDDSDDYVIPIQLVGGREMAQACGALYETVVERQALRHLNQESLNAAVSGAKKRPLLDAWAWHRRDSGTNIAPLVALTEALHGFVLYGGAADALDNIW